jgi:hypothetical protein
LSRQKYMQLKVKGVWLSAKTIKRLSDYYILPIITANRLSDYYILPTATANC